MIIGIGCDIVEHNTTKLLKWEEDINLLQRILSSKEFEIYNIQKNIRFIAGRFAAKEAVLKCLGLGMQDGISLTEIQILQSINGQPVLELTGETKKISDEIGINSWHISITHSTNHSIAFIIAEHKD